jgi:hypothetical protein
MGLGLRALNRLAGGTMLDLLGLLASAARHLDPLAIAAEPRWGALEKHE